MCWGLVVQGYGQGSGWDLASVPYLRYLEAAARRAPSGHSLFPKATLTQTLPSFSPRLPGREALQGLGS